MWFPIPVGLALILWFLLYGVFLVPAYLNFVRIAERRGVWVILAIPIFFIIGMACMIFGHFVRTHFLVVAGIIGYVWGALICLMGIFVLIREIAEWSERKQKDSKGLEHAKEAKTNRKEQKERELISNPELAFTRGENYIKQRTITDIVEKNKIGAAKVLIGALQDKDREIRNRAAWALGELRAKEAIPALTGLLSDENETVRYTAQQAIEKM